MLKPNCWASQPWSCLPYRFAWTSAVLLLGLAIGCGGPKNELVKPEPPTVSVAQPLKQPFRPFMQMSGVTEAVESAEVRSRVRGYIQEIAFEPGQTVTGTVVAEDGSESGGSVLYRIERSEYEAAYNAAVSARAAADAAVGVAQSQVKVAEATLEKTKAERDRQQELRQRGVSSNTEFEAAIAAFKSAEANMTAAQASVTLAQAQSMQAESTVNQAKLDLDYTVIRAPIDGQVSTTLVKLGNLVEPGTQLAFLTDGRQIFVNFSVSDREALKYFERQSTENLSPEGNIQRWAKQKVYLAREIDKDYSFVGTLDYVDQTGVDVATGTLGLRAKFDNTSRQLLPGLFVRLRLPSSDAKEAILIPDSCVLRTSRKTYVLTVGPDNTVDETTIEIGDSIDGWVTVTSGLDESSQVIVEGIQKAQKGSVVNPNKIELVRKEMWGDEEADGQVEIEQAELGATQ